MKGDPRWGGERWEGKGAKGCGPMKSLYISTTNHETQEYQRLSVQLSIDLFGGVVILAIVIDGKENSLGISKEFGTGLIVMASLSFLLTLLQNGGNNLGNIDGCVSRRKKAVIAP